MNSKYFNKGFLLLDKKLKILYEDEELKKAYPKIEIGDYCFKALHGRNGFCDNCPILFNTRQDKILLRPENSDLAEETVATVELPNSEIYYSISVQNLGSEESFDNNFSPINKNSIIKEQQLLENNALWNAALNNMPNGYHRYTDDEGYPFLYISDRFCEILGYSREEIYTLFDGKMINMLHPEDKNALLFSKDKLNNENKNQYNETVYRIKGKNGYLWVLDSTKLVQIGNQKFYQGAITDITSYIEAQNGKDRALIKTEGKISQYKKAIISGANAIYEVNVTKDVLENASFILSGKEFTRSMFNNIKTPCSYTWAIENIATKILGEDKDKFIQNNGIKSLSEHYEKGMLEWQFEYDTISGNKEYNHIRKSFLLTKDSEQSDLYALIVAKDISEEIKERHKQELLLKKQKESLTKALESAKQRLHIIDGLCCDYHSIFYIDSKTGDCIPYILPEREKQQYEKNLQKKTHFNLYDAQYIKDTIVPEDIEYIRQKTQREVVLKELERNDIYDIKYRVNVNGRIEHAQIRIVQIGEDKDQVWAFRSIENLVQEEFNHQKQLQDALEKAQEAERTKTEFLLNVSHDIRTPMNAIMGFNKIAQKNIDDKEKAAEALKKSEIASRHLLNLINEVLEMARIESGKFELNEEIVSANDYFDEIKEMFQATMEEKNIDFEVESFFKEKFVYTDALRITQLITNLLDNAIKFTKPGGKILYSSKETGKSDDGYVTYEIHITDTGIGMSKEFQSKLFDAFEREKNTTNSGILGTGLGLAIAKNIANMLGGSLTCKSELGKGTDFTFIFRARAAQDPKATTFLDSDAETEITNFTDKRILLVEDNELNREIATEFLSEYGFKIDCAGDGAVAVEKVKKSEAGYYNLVLMDIQMPYMDGYKATEEIRCLNNKELANIPIVAMTANAFSEDKKKALKAGMNGFLTKPLNIPDLLKVLKEFLQ